MWDFSQCLICDVVGGEPEPLHSNYDMVLGDVVWKLGVDYDNRIGVKRRR